MKHLRHFLPLVAAIAILLVIFALWVPQNRFLTPGNLMDLAQQISVNAILASGLTLVILIGGIDLSVGAIVALAGVVCVSVLGVAGPLGGLAAGLGAAVLCGVTNGLCAARTRMPPFIITLATMLVARGMALGFNESRPLPIGGDEALMLAFGNARVGGWLPLPVVVMVAVFAATAVLLHRTRFGQHLFAIGGNREASVRAGVPADRLTILIFMLSATTAGLAGILHTARFSGGSAIAGDPLLLNSIAAVIIGGVSMFGGRGNIIGTVIGSLIIAILVTGLIMLQVDPFWQWVVVGIVVILAVLIDQARDLVVGRAESQ